MSSYRLTFPAPRRDWVDGVSRQWTPESMMEAQKHGMWFRKPVTVHHDVVETQTKPSAQDTGAHANCGCILSKRRYADEQR